MCGDKYEPDVSIEKYLKTLIEERVSALKGIMDEREKASIVAAQSLITKDGAEQLAKFVLKEELNNRIKELQDMITGPLGLELRMRFIEQARGAMDAKMFMIVIGLSAMITAIMTVVLHVIFKF